jgi:hypothetical protein
MIEVRRSDRKVIHADPIQQKDRERAWEQIIRKIAPEAIKEAMEGRKEHDRAV